MLSCFARQREAGHAGRHLLKPSSKGCRALGGTLKQPCKELPSKELCSETCETNILPSFGAGWRTPVRGENLSFRLSCGASRWIVCEQTRLTFQVPGSCANGAMERHQGHQPHKGRRMAEVSYEIAYRRWPLADGPWLLVRGLWPARVCKTFGPKACKPFALSKRLRPMLSAYGFATRVACRMGFHTVEHVLRVPNRGRSDFVHENTRSISVFRG